MPKRHYVKGASSGVWQAYEVPKEKAAPEVAALAARLALANEELKALGRGMTQNEIAEAAGFQQSGVSRFLRGLRGLEAKNLINLMVFADRAGVSVRYLITGEGIKLRGSADDVGLAEELKALLETHQKTSVFAKEAVSDSRELRHRAGSLGQRRPKKRITKAGGGEQR